MGPTIAHEVLYFGRKLTAYEAEKYGLVSLALRVTSENLIMLTLKSGDRRS